MKPLRQLFLEHIGQTSPSPLLVEVSKAEGVYFYDPEGKKYFDLIAGVTVNNVGHNNPVVRKAIADQLDRFSHVMVYGELVMKPQVEYAHKLAEHLPEPLECVYFLNSGSEAVEGALKLAKRYTGRTKIVSCRNAYHGSTQGSLSVLGGEELKNKYRPLIPGVEQINYNDFDDLKTIDNSTAAVIIEPVQSEAGVINPLPGYLEAVRHRCTETGTLLIFDEIQTGFGRIGGLFATNLFGVTPDIICLAKALGGGMPLGAFVSSKEIMSVLSHDPCLGHISTFGGHPVCCAAGLAAFEFIVSENLPANAERIGCIYENELVVVPQIQEIRRAGLLMAVELGSSEKLFAAMSKLLANGVMSDWFLFCDTAFRISPPLNITEEECCESIELIKKALDSI